MGCTPPTITHPHPHTPRSGGEPSGQRRVLGSCVSPPQPTRLLLVPGLHPCCTHHARCTQHPCTQPSPCNPHPPYTSPCSLFAPTVQPPPRYAQTPNALSEHAAHPLQPAPVPAPPPAPSAPSAAAELPAQCPAAPPPRLLPQCRGARCRSGGVTRSIVGEPPATGHCQRRSSSRREGRCSHCWWPGWGRGARTLGCCMPTGAPREPQAGRGQLPALPSPVTAAALSEEAALLFHPALVKNTTPDFNTAAASAILGREQEAKPRVGPGPARPPHLRATPRGEPGARAAAPARCPEVPGAVGAI